MRVIPPVISRGNPDISSGFNIDLLLVVQIKSSKQELGIFEMKIKNYFLKLINLEK